MGKITEIGLLFIFIFGISAVSKKLKIPHLLSLLLGGLIGKFIFPADIANEVKILETMALTLLFFFLGLDFSFERLFNMMRRIFVAGVIDFLFNFFGILLVSYLITKDLIFSLVVSAALYPSSTAITIKLISDYKRVPFAETDVILGILIIEDIVSIALISFLFPISTGEKIDLIKIANGFLVFLIFFLLFFLLRKPAERIFTKLPEIISEEVLAFLVLGLVLAPSDILARFGISDILIAFLLGCLVPEKSEMYNSIQKHLYGLKEFSAGLFFFFFTFDMDLKLSTKDILLIISLTFVALITKFISTYLSSVYTIRSKTPSYRSAFSMLQRGEFSLVISSISAKSKTVVPIAVIISSIVGVISFVYAPALSKYLSKIMTRKDKTKS